MWGITSLLPSSYGYAGARFAINSALHDCFCTVASCGNQNRPLNKPEFRRIKFTRKLPPNFGTLIICICLVIHYKLKFYTLCFEKGKIERRFFLFKSMPNFNFAEALNCKKRRRRPPHCIFTMLVGPSPSKKRRENIYQGPKNTKRRVLGTLSVV